MTDNKNSTDKTTSVNAPTGTTHTRLYGSDAQTGSVSRSNTEGESAEQFVERSLVERHGESIRQNPKFKELVADEKAQIAENIRVTKGM